MLFMLLPALWWRIDRASNGRGHPANAETEQEQEGRLHLLGTSNRLHKQENHRPGDGETNAVDPIVPVPRYIRPPFFRSLYDAHQPERRFSGYARFAKIRQAFPGSKPWWSTPRQIGKPARLPPASAPDADGIGGGPNSRRDVLVALLRIAEAARMIRARTTRRGGV